MDKNAIKKYAVWARTELIERVTQKALQYGISEKNIIDANADSINGKILTDVEKKQRRALIIKINDKGFEQVMEEVAYTWFNRFAALRFMEVNGYLPSHVRVFTDEENNFKPQILTEAIHLEIDGLDMDKVYSFKEENKNDELYKYLLIVQCNALNKILPGMFQKISDYTELLLPDNLLREGSVIQQMIEIIPEEDWKDAVQIIGWLYQYYNSVPKDTVFANLKKNIKIKKEDIPAATQLFTPDWIVRYMVENSLGRLWYEGHPDETLKANWKYYLDEAEQEAEVQAQLDKIREEYKGMKPEDIKCIDPCMGSGHILVYMFDVLMQIYESYGYNAREAVDSILKNNLYGLDIDDRAAQLAYFAVMMKARQYDRRFFSRNIQPHIHVIVESNNISSDSIDYFSNGKPELKAAIKSIIDEMHDAKEYGSILNITNVDYETLYARFYEMQDEVSLFKKQVVEQLLPLVQVAQAIAQKYDIVVTNPPYMAAGNMDIKLSTYLKKYFPEFKSDFFSAFIVRCENYAKQGGYCAFLSPYVWMFIQSYESLRLNTISEHSLISLIQFEYSAFEEATVPICAFVIGMNSLDYKGMFVRLTDFRGGMDVQKERTLFAISDHDCGYYYEMQISKCLEVPGYPIAFWENDSTMELFKNPNIALVAFSDGQILTGDNNRFLRLLWEVDATTIKKEGSWMFHAKGGEFRKWYGNIEYVVNWKPEAINFYKKDKIARFPKEEILFRRGITWSLISTNPIFGVRLLTEDVTFNKAAATVLFNDESKIEYCMGLLNSAVINKLTKLINPTLNNNIKDILAMPLIECKDKNEEVKILVEQCIAISKADWDSFETSWNFSVHPFISYRSGAGYADVPMEKWKYKIADAFRSWKSKTEAQFNQLKSNEEELNRIFINIYGLEDELKSEIEDKDITVRKADLARDIKSLISYAVGCMFGRYSLDVEGLVFAGGEWDDRKYTSYPADTDNIIPICDDEYFEDDIVGRFVKFVETVYGKETLDENLKFIADALGGKGMPKDIIRNYFLNNFFADHCKTYQKRPIYWLFDSGKKNGFKCLIYMHRYQPDTIARIRTDYVHEQQARYRTAILDLEQRIHSATTSERVKLNKQLTKLKDQESELRTYEEKIHHLADQMIPIDLDDGVKVNYEKFQEVLAKIK